MIKPEKILQYCDKQSYNLPEYFHELERETYLKTLAPQMLSGKIQGRLLQTIIHLGGFKNIIEIGTFTGYSAFSMAEAIPENGMVHTIEINEEITWIFNKYAEKSTVGNKIKLHIGDAHNIIPKLDLEFDMAFIDGAKEDYLTYLDLIIPKIREGGAIIADNVLWGGKVVEDNPDQTTQVIQQFNLLVKNHPNLEPMVLPIRDGITIMRKL